MRKTNKRVAFSVPDIPKLLILLFFLAFVLLPLARMLCSITPDSIRRVFSSSVMGTAVRNTLISSGAATVITVVLAYAAAMCTERVRRPLRGVFRAVFVLPMLIPSISHGMGLIILFGNNGLLTKALHMTTNIYGMKGIVFGSVLYSFPVAYLMLSDVLRYENGSPYEAARVLGIDAVHRLTAITLPYLRKPLASVFFAVFAMIATDYGVPLMVGGKYKTVATTLYEEVIGQLEYGKGAVYGVLLLIPAVTAFIFDVLKRDRGSDSYSDTPPKRSEAMPARLFSFAFCTALCVLIALPIVASMLHAFAKSYPSDMTPTLSYVKKTLQMKADKYLLNSVLMSLFTSLVGIFLSFSAAYLTSRMRSGVTRLIHLASMVCAAVPGVVLGLSYVLVFRGSVLYGTLAILIMVNTVHFFASPYLMMYNTLSKLNSNLEAVGSTLGISRIRMITDVIIPQCIPTVAEMFSYFFVNCMMTISAVSFLSNTANKPVSLMINQFEAQMQLESAAVVSLAILTVNCTVKGLIYAVKKAAGKHIQKRKCTVR